MHSITRAHTSASCPEDVQSELILTQEGVRLQCGLYGATSSISSRQLRSQGERGADGECSVCSDGSGTAADACYGVRRRYHVHEMYTLNALSTVLPNMGHWPTMELQKALQGDYLTKKNHSRVLLAASMPDSCARRERGTVPEGSSDIEGKFDEL